MNRFTLILLLPVFASLPLHGQWRIINEGENGGYDRIDFFSDDVGWMADSKTLFRTEDFGISWTKVDIADIENGYINTVDFLSDSVGWILIRDNIADKSKVFFTENGGKTWQLRNEPTSVDLNSLQALDENHVFIEYEENGLLKTIDGGETWVDISLPDKDNKSIRSMWFINKEVGVVLGGNGSNNVFISRTLDGGKTWGEHMLDLNGAQNLQFINDSTAYFVGDKDGSGLLFCESKDTCRTWSIKFHSDSYIYNYRFISPDTVYFFMEDSILLSTDGGATRQILPSLTDFGSGGEVYFNSKNEGLMTADVWMNYWTKGKIAFRSNNRGTDWNMSLLTYPFTSTYFINEKKGFAAGGCSIPHSSRGDVFITNDGGNSWHLNFRREWGEVNSIKFVNEKTGFILTNERGCAIYKTTDGGNNWNLLAELRDSILGNKLIFTDENTGWVVGYNYNSEKAVIMRSTDGGQSWSQVWNSLLTTSSPSELYSIHFADSVGWAVGDAGMMVRYTDEQQWRKIDSPTDLPLNKVFFTDKNHGWIAGGYFNNESFASIFLKTDNGGATWSEQHFDKYIIHDLYFADSLHGWAVGSDTVDDNPPGKGIILETINGGDTWTTQVDSLSAPLNAIYFKDGYGWAVGENGLILKMFDPTFTSMPEYQNTENSNILLQTYPNPFNSQTIINYQLTQNSDIELSVFNLMGKKVTTLVKEKQQAGKYEVEWNASGLRPGIYFCELKSGQSRKVLKMVLLRD